MRLITTLFGSRKRRIIAAAAVLGALATTGLAVAAFVLFTGASGSTSGTIETATINAAITVAENNAGSPVPVGGSNSGSSLKLQNVDTAAHQLNTLTGTFSSSPSQCASHLSYSMGGSNPVGTSLNPGQTLIVPITYSADATVPAACSAATWTLAWTGTTSP